MADLDALYSGVILDHNRHPRNYRRLATDRQSDRAQPALRRSADGLFAREGDVIEEAAFEGFGCAIATASASLMTESVTGKTVADAEALLSRVQRMSPRRRESVEDQDLGTLSALAGVREFPVRVKCVLLPWRALSGRPQTRGEGPVSTE